MPNKKITDLPAAAALGGTEPVETVQGGASVRTTAADIAALAGVPSLPLAIGHGGTGESTAQLALDALFATVAKGTLQIGDGTHNTPVAVGANGDVLTADSAQPNGLKWAAAAGGIAIGSPVAGATATRLLFSAAGPVLAESAGLIFDASNRLILTGGGVVPAMLVNDGLGTIQVAVALPGSWSILTTNSLSTVRLGGPNFAAQFLDAARTVSICDGVNNVTYSPGVPADWAAAAPTDVWVALDRLAAWIAANFPVPPPP